MRNQSGKARTVPLRITSSVVLAVCPLLVVGYVRPVIAQTSSTRTFSSAEEASNALFRAAQNKDEHQLEEILGAGTEVTSSGDELEDKREQEQFTSKYQEMHRLVRETDGRTILYIGAENWPFPIPLISTRSSWHFDSNAGRQEILFRTIGENEFAAIQFCKAFVSAKQQGSSSNTAEDSFAQALALLRAADSADAASRNNQSFHGYYFQTENRGGRVVLVAFPVKYKATGVMTFLVTKDGIVYEKDLGPHTPTVAPKLTLRTPDSSWHQSE